MWLSKATGSTGKNFHEGNKYNALSLLLGRFKILKVLPHAVFSSAPAYSRFITLINAIQMSASQPMPTGGKWTLVITMFKCFTSSFENTGS